MIPFAQIYMIELKGQGAQCWSLFAGRDVLSIAEKHGKDAQSLAIQVIITRM